MMTLQEFVYRLEKNRKPHIRYSNESKEKEIMRQLIDEYDKRDELVEQYFDKRYAHHVDIDENQVPEQSLGNFINSIRKQVSQKETRKLWTQII